MKKLLGMIAAVMMITAMAATAAAEVTDNGEIYFYDFSDYDVEMGKGIGADENWGALAAANRTYTKSFGSFDLNDGKYGRVMLAKQGGEPSFLFPEMLTSGKMRVSFDARLTSDNLRTLWLFYTGVYAEPSTSGFGKALFINSPDRKSVSYYPSTMGWTKEILNENFDGTEWHHYDFVTSELSGSNAMMSCYIDGELIYSNTNVTPAKGIRSWGFRVEKIDGTLEANDGLIVDNVYLRHYSGSDDFAADRIGKGRISVKDAKIRIAANERIVGGISKNNVEITNSNSGKSIDNFSVEDINGQTFDISFNGEIENGRYNISFKNIVGELSGARLSSVLSIETEYKSEVVMTDYEDISFNDYTSNDGTLPLGFENIDSTDDIYAKSVQGKSGDANDFALGFSGMPQERKQKRAMYKFASPISENTEFDISFDMYSSGAAGYFYLADKDDFSADNSDYKNNSLVSVNANGVLMYSSGRSQSPDKILDSELSLTPGIWHNIKIKVLPSLNENKSYFVISVDGGKDYTVETSREFHKNAVYGMGVGYLKTSTDDADVRFDNIKINGSKIIYYPEADSIKAYNALGEEVGTASDASAMISEVRAEFNTLISPSLDGLISVTEDGAEMPVSYEVENDSEKGRSTLIIRFDELLSPYREYTVTLFKGIPSAYSNSVTSFLEYSKSIKADNEIGFKCHDTGYDKQTKTAKLVFSKNDKTSGTFIYVVGEYKTVTRQTADGEKQTQLLTNVRYVPITISAEDRGRFEYTLNLENTADDTEIKTFVWKYPKLEKLIVGDDGTIN